MQYLWQYRTKSACGTSWSGWNNWVTSQSVGTWAYGGNVDHQFRRAAKRSTCGSWAWSNTITFTVEKPITNAGTISGGGNYCNNLPGNQTITGNAASGGCGGSMQYLWQYRTKSACGTSWSGWNNWVTSQSVGTWAYGGNVDHQFRRAAKRSTCGSWAWSNTITFTVEKPITNACLLYTSPSPRDS